MLIEINFKPDATALSFITTIGFSGLITVSVLRMTSNTDHKITSNLPMATTISPAMKMVASAHCGCQTVCLMADSSATAAVSSQREAASIFPIVPNEISITNMQVYQYFHRFLPHRARARRLHDGWNTAPVCTVRVGGLHMIQLMILKNPSASASLACSLILRCFHPRAAFSLCSAHASKAIAWCRAPSNGLFVNLFYSLYPPSLSAFPYSISLTETDTLASALTLYIRVHMCLCECFIWLSLHRNSFSVYEKMKRMAILCSVSCGHCPAVTLSAATGDRPWVAAVGLTPDMNCTQLWVSNCALTCQPEPTQQLEPVEFTISVVVWNWKPCFLPLFLFIPPSSYHLCCAFKWILAHFRDAAVRNKCPESLRMRIKH